MKSNPTRPNYDMASDKPLVLWDCIFPHESEVQSSEEREKGYEDRLEWIYVGMKGGIDPKTQKYAKEGEPPAIGLGKWGRGGVVEDMWEVWRGHKIDETLSALLVDRMARIGASTLDKEQDVSPRKVGMVRSGPRIFDGGDFGRIKGPYKRVLERARQDPIEVVNERYATRKGWNASQAKEVEEDSDISN